MQTLMRKLNVYRYIPEHAVAEMQKRGFEIVESDEQGEAEKPTRRPRAAAKKDEADENDGQSESA